MNRFLFACALGMCAMPLLAPSAAHAATVSLSISDGRLVEPPSGQKSIIFPVTLSGVRSEDVRVTYETAVGPNAGTADSSILAQPNLDFTPRQGQLTIPAGTLRAQIEIPVLSDSEVEKDETFVVNLSNLLGYDNSGTNVVFKRATAMGTIVEPVKGIVLGGQVASYVVNPSPSGYDPTTGVYRDTFDIAAQQVVQSGASVTVTGTNFYRRVTTDSQGRYTVLVRPGTYSVQVDDFSRSGPTGITSTYSYPARTVSLTRESRANNFYFYGIAGTVAVSNSSSSSSLSPAYVKVDARPYGADPTSTPVASDYTSYYDTRGYRFFIPALPPGRYTLGISSPYSDGYDYYNQYYKFPTITVTLPATTGVNRPVARVQIVGTPKTSTSSVRSTKSSSASGS